MPVSGSLPCGASITGDSPPQTPPSYAAGLIVSITTLISPPRWKMRGGWVGGKVVVGAPKYLSGTGGAVVNAKPPSPFNFPYETLLMKTLFPQPTAIRI